jgi:hypothetical protein
MRCFKACSINVNCDEYAYILEGEPKINIRHIILNRILRDIGLEGRHLIHLAMGKGFLQNVVDTIMNLRVT